MLTSHEILKEYTKGLVNPTYVIETYLETFDKTQEGFVPFQLFPRQKEIIRAYEAHRFNLVTKPRQAGVSTTTAAYMAVKVGWADSENPENVLIIANKQELAFEFLAKIKDFLSQLPRWVWGDEYYGNEKKESKSIFLTDSKKEIKLPNGSRVKAVATSKDALRGFTPTFLIMDEAAYIDNGAEVFGAALTALGTGGRATLISTPNGMDSLYYKTYDQARTKKNNFNVIEMKWYEDLRYNKDLRWYKDDSVQQEVIFTFESYKTMLDDGWKPSSTWYEQMCMGMNNDVKMIAQELDVSFIGSGGNVINEEFIEYQEKNNVKEPLYVEGLEHETWIWAIPEEGHQYVMGCLPPDEKVLTDSGLKNIQDVDITDKLISENGDYVDIINKQIYPVIDEDIFEIQMDNTFRTTTFTKEHPILISKPNLKRNYNKTHDKYNLNQRFWNFDFDYVRMETVRVGDWVRVPNIYKKENTNFLDDKWKISNDIRCDFEVDSPLLDEDFWWFIGMWLGDGWLGHYNKDSYTISICFDKSHHSYIEKCESIIKKLFKRSPSFIDKGTTFEVVFNSKFLYHFILENFGQYSTGKKIIEWVKLIPNNFKKELVRGYFDSDGCWIKIVKNGKTNSKVSFVSVNLELLESVQDIIFSLGIISTLNKLRNSKITEICGKVCQQKEAYNLTLGNHDSLDLIKLIYKSDDIKLNKFKINEFNTINKRPISSCHFDDTKDNIYFRVKGINKTKYTGNVYNFECETHTFMCHHITTHNCDVSRGDGEDASTIVVVDVTTMEQVMEYQGKIQPDLLAQIVEQYGDLYKAYTVVDVTGGMGVSTVLKLLEFQYKRLHYDNANGKILSARQRELSSHGKVDKIPGFHATSVRVPMISNLEYQIRTNGIKVRSSRMVSEMKTFIFKNGRPDHMEGYHDDLLMAIGMALWVIEHSFKNLERLEKQTKAMLTSWVAGGTDNPVTTPMPGDGFVSVANRHVVANKSPKFNPVVSKNMQDPTGKYMWLFSGSR
jgi:intein/homing endonuclease